LQLRALEGRIGELQGIRAPFSELGGENAGQKFFRFVRFASLVAEAGVI
jgi:hypothetical protein